MESTCPCCDGRGSIRHLNMHTPVFAALLFLASDDETLNRNLRIAWLATHNGTKLATAERYMARLEAMLEAHLEAAQ